ncbi:MAG: DUF4040 domain-containing protein [Calditrichia bacterium]
MSIVIIILLGIAMLAAAFAAIYLKDLVAAVVAAGLVSLMASVLYLLMAAPDVAMTEAAIGAGLSTVIFLYAIRKTAHREVDND